MLAERPLLFLCPFFSAYAKHLGREENKMNSFMSWVGGKKALRDEILIRFPADYKRYIEVFGGGGWVLFHKPSGNDFEVYNDFNPNLVNLYRCVRDKAQELEDALTLTLNSRLDFRHMKSALEKPCELGDVKRAAYFYQIIRQSYASGCDTYGGQPRAMWNNFPAIRAACGRLQNVVIENKDFEKLINQYDREESFFYCDPPYYATENYYDGGGFDRDSHIRLANCLCSIKGKFLLSYNDCPEIREMYDRPGICIEAIERLSNIAQRYEGGKMYSELFIANYDTTERERQTIQLSLFDGLEDYKNVLNERKIILCNQ